MKKILVKALFSILAGSIALVGNAQNTTTVPDSTKKPLSSFREEIQKVIKTEDKGVIRGFDFGTPVSVIKDKETAEYIADGKDFAIYKVPLNEKEFAEIIYYLDGQKKVKGFGVEFIILEENFKLEENIVNDFEKYFTSRYGKHFVNKRNDEVWDGGTYTVEMGDSSEGGSALEIEIEIFPKPVVKK